MGTLFLFFKEKEVRVFYYNSNRSYHNHSGQQKADIYPPNKFKNYLKKNAGLFTYHWRRRMLGQMMRRLVQTGVGRRTAGERILVAQRTAAHCRIEAERVASSSSAASSTNTSVMAHHWAPVGAQVNMFQHLHVPKKTKNGTHALVISSHQFAAVYYIEHREKLLIERGLLNTYGSVGKRNAQTKQKKYENWESNAPFMRWCCCREGEKGTWWRPTPWHRANCVPSLTFDRQRQVKSKKKKKLSAARGCTYSL